MCLITAQWDEAVSPREPEGSSSLPVAIFCLRASPRPFYPPLPPFWFLLRTEMQSKGRQILRYVLSKMMQERYVGKSNHCVHFPWSDPLSRWYVLRITRSKVVCTICFCFLHRTFLQYDSWGEDRRRQQISLCRKCKTCISVISSYWACFFSHLWSDTLLNKSQVDYGATADELEIHFNGCGPVNRVTILCDRFSGHPKGWVQLVLTVYSFFFFYPTLFDHIIQL